LPTQAQRVKPRSEVKKSAGVIAGGAVKVESADLPVFVAGGFDPQLRQALTDSLRVSRIVLAESEEQAKAVLRPEPTRGSEIVVELIGRNNERLWWMTAKVSNSRELADEIVVNLLDKVRGLKRGN
jgi:hypothetical protein